MPKWLQWVIAVCAVVWTAAVAYDSFKTEPERAKTTLGIPSVDDAIGGSAIPSVDDAIGN